MFLELIAVIVAGVAGGGLAHVAGRLSGGRLPRWSVPIAAGATMLGASIASEYSWYARTAAALPQGVEVAQTVEASAPWRPWTYVAPLTDRFVAVDTGHLRANQSQEGLYLADLYFFGRWKPVTSVEVMVDCPGARRADPGLDPTGGVVWRTLGPSDPLIAAVCAGARG